MSIDDASDHGTEDDSHQQALIQRGFSPPIVVTWRHTTNILVQLSTKCAILPLKQDKLL